MVSLPSFLARHYSRSSSVCYSVPSPAKRVTSSVLCLTGSKVISPFGALGVIMREKIRRALHEQYPALHDHVRAGGMATFLGDIAIDLSILEDDPRSDAHPPIHPAAVTSVGSGSPEKESKSSYV
ncbi:hypothetical protein JAAARDRAFT_432060 [Jaapia argillacea MUCL 33604]|uniref:Uncharacterized protein n=1 Tax=Jaapia argillacea MUCL 33604 TaxID=933084 RepID=A0A067PPS2_9AGAM|nr:hypothetical protein JAAARDRAFT_432060 [Jaapia argillacea MUCL 33604]